MHRLQAKRHAATRSMRGKSDLGIEGLVHVVREGVEGDMDDDLDDLSVAVAGITGLGDFGYSDGTASHCQCPGEFDCGSCLGIVRRAVAVGSDFTLVELGKLRTGEGVGREAAVTAVGLSHGERDAFAGADGSLPLPSAPWSDVRPVNAAGLLDTSLKMFGTEPICFWTVSRIGREASGASSMVAGVGMRDIVFSFFG